jgi:alanine racemase
LHHRDTSKTWVEINTDTLRSNLRLLRKAIGPKRSVVLIVKSDAYGHGAETVAAQAYEEGVRHFGIANVSEGVILRRAGVAGEIILLHPPLEFEIDQALDAELSPTISSFETAAMISSRAIRKAIGVHIEINTGVNRLGLDSDTAAETIARIAALPRIKINGVFTHFRATDSRDTTSIQAQLDQFEKVVSDKRLKEIPLGLCHAASSHAVAHFPHSYLKAIRPGLIVYTGFNGATAPSPALAASLPDPLQQMRNVMSVYSRVLHTRRVAEGEWIHYGEMYRAPRSMNVAVVPIGYGMGFPRALSNKAEMLIHGHRVPVVGAVGMDMTIVATDKIPSVRTGDLVTVIGEDGGEHITAAELARHADTIPYEIVCRLGNALPRYVVGETGVSRAGEKRQRALIS